MLLTKNKLYRLSGDFESPLPYPTPLEFATFIVDESKRIGIEYLDIHFRPQWFSCPFCALEFDMIGSSEDFESDFDFFVKEHGLKVSTYRCLIPCPSIGSKLFWTSPNCFELVQIVLDWVKRQN